VSAGGFWQNHGQQNHFLGTVAGHGSVAALYDYRFPVATVNSAMHIQSDCPSPVVIRTTSNPSGCGFSHHDFAVNDFANNSKKPIRQS
jgi:hypothetical protein